MPDDTKIETQDQRNIGGSAGVVKGLTYGEFASAGFPAATESSAGRSAPPVGCGASCELPHASAECRDGACSVLQCESDWADCDGVQANGCETNLLASVKHCGECGKVCHDATNGTSICQGGNCRLSNCVAPYGDCDGNTSNGCESNGDTDLNNCGGCGVGCQLPHSVATCSSGNCAVAVCEEGWADCNGFAADGCEIDVLDNLSHCGSCRASCAPEGGVGECVQGECSISGCNPGLKDCNQSADDGCESDPQSDPANCGACGVACEAVNGTSSCEHGTCTIACTSGYADCDGNAANGCETQTLDDTAHCGGCNQACEGRCEAGACVMWPCAGICDNPKLIVIGIGAIYGLDQVVCHESYQATQAFTSGNCGQFTEGHDLYVNGVVVSCLDGEDWGFTDATRPPPRYGGYCFHDEQLGNNGKSAWFTPW